MPVGSSDKRMGHALTESSRNGTAQELEEDIKHISLIWDCYPTSLRKQLKGAARPPPSLPALLGGLASCSAGQGNKAGGGATAG